MRKVCLCIMSRLQFLSLPFLPRDLPPSSVPPSPSLFIPPSLPFSIRKRESMLLHQICSISLDTILYIIYRESRYQHHMLIAWRRRYAAIISVGPSAHPKAFTRTLSSSLCICFELLYRAARVFKPPEAIRILSQSAMAGESKMSTRHSWAARDCK